jgi:hypothetical protein
VGPPWWRAQRRRPFAFFAVVFFDEDEPDAFLAVGFLAGERVPSFDAAFVEVTDLTAAERVVDFLAPDAFEDFRADVAGLAGTFAERRDLEVVLDAFFAVPVFLVAPGRLELTTVSVPGPGMTVVSSPESQRTRRRAPLLPDTVPLRGVSPILRPATSITSPTLTMRASRYSSLANAQWPTGSPIAAPRSHPRREPGDRHGSPIVGLRNRRVEIAPGPSRRVA